MHYCVHVRVCGSPGRVTARGGPPGPRSLREGMGSLLGFTLVPWLPWPGNQRWSLRGCSIIKTPHHGPSRTHQTLCSLVLKLRLMAPSVKTTLHASSGKVAASVADQ